MEKGVFEGRDDNRDVVVVQAVGLDQVAAVLVNDEVAADAVEPARQRLRRDRARLKRAA